MKIFDCTTYYNEPMIYNLRLNILDKKVDEFVVCEALYTHKGEKKKINFDKDLYPKFKNRITHLIVHNEPENLITLEKNSSKENIHFVSAGEDVCDFTTIFNTSKFSLYTG